MSPARYQTLCKHQQDSVASRVSALFSRHIRNGTGLVLSSCRNSCIQEQSYELPMPIFYFFFFFTFSTAERAPTMAPSLPQTATPPGNSHVCPRKYLTSLSGCSHLEIYPRDVTTKRRPAGWRARTFVTWLLPQRSPDDAGVAEGSAGKIYRA